jgi:SAM-dependent methyltransferase
MARRLVGKGIEIGAFHGPQFLPHGEVRYVDLMTRAEARRFFPEVPLAMTVVDPDILASAERLSMLADGSQDFVVASHMLEHTEDPIAALSEWHRVLRPGGCLYLCLPDKRGTFDRDRERTTLEHLVEDHACDDEERADRNTAHYREWAREISRLEDAGQVRFWADLLQRVQYPIHFHCWIPDDIEGLIAYVNREERLSFNVVDAAVMREGYEFAFFMERGDG